MNTQHERNATHDGRAARRAGRASAMARAGVLIAIILAASVVVASLPEPERDPVPAPTIKEPKPRPPPAPALTPERGRLLYENHCTECHESVVCMYARAAAPAPSLSWKAGCGIGPRSWA